MIQHLGNFCWLLLGGFPYTLHMSKLPYLEIMNNDVSSSLFMLLQHTTPKHPMTSLCIACRDTIRYHSVHSCTKLDLRNNDDVFACRSFEHYFDLMLGEEVFVSGNNLTLDEKNEDHFFHHHPLPAAAAVTHCGGGKDMAYLRSEALQELTTFMDSCQERVDILRPASDMLRASKVRMYLS